MPNQNISTLISTLFPKDNVCTDLLPLSPQQLQIITSSTGHARHTRMEEEAKAKGVKFEPADALAGMGTRTVDFKYRVDEYSDFIHNKLLPALVARGIKIPDDPNKIVLVGSSLGGTASIYMGITYLKWFGKIVAQSPSINNRGKLEEIIARGEKPPPPEIFLSCGELESPEYAKNLNLPFAFETEQKQKTADQQEKVALQQPTPFFTKPAPAPSVKKGDDKQEQEEKTDNVGVSTESKPFHPTPFSMTMGSDRYEK